MSSSRSIPLPVSRSTAARCKTIRLCRVIYLSCVMTILRFADTCPSPASCCGALGVIGPWGSVLIDPSVPDGSAYIGSVISVSSPPDIGTSWLSSSLALGCISPRVVGASSSSKSISSCSTWMMDCRRRLYASRTKAGVIYKAVSLSLCKKRRSLPLRYSLLEQLPRLDGPCSQVDEL